MSEDAAAHLIGAVVDQLKGADAGWESWSIVIELGAGRVKGTHGYAYGPGDTVSAVAARPSGVQAAVLEYLAGRPELGDDPPVKLLVQFDRVSGGHEITVEGTGTGRWKVTPANLDEIADELRPRLER